LFSSIVLYGFSCPSTALVSRAVYSSVSGIVSEIAPMSLNASTITALGITRIFTPEKSSALVIGRREFVVCR